VHQLGGYRVQRDEAALMHDARAAADAGAFAMVLECIPASVAKKITEMLSIPTIGIGAGVDCDGQVLVMHDVLGLTTNYAPRFVKAYADLKTTVVDAVRQFRDEVRETKFPRAEHTFE
jgi:3-methyl-2-oxobutanoate hydroxymethyltransferase